VYVRLVKTPDSDALGYRWVMLALLWIVYFAFGMILSSIPPLVTPIAIELGLTRSQMGFILGSFQMIYIPVAISIGFLIDRVGIRGSILVGVMIASLSGVLRSFATDFTTMFLSVAVFGLGGPIISVGAPKVVASWFTGRDRGTASGIYMTGPVIGVATALMITNSVIVPLVGTWRNTLRLYGFIGFLTTIIWLIFGRESEQTQSRVTVAIPLRDAFTKLLREKNVWLVVVIGFSAFFQAYGLSGWLPNLMEMKGMTSVEAGFWASIPTWMGIVGNILFPRLGKKGSRKNMVAVTLLIQGISMFIVSTTTGLPLMISLIFYGISTAPTVTLLIVILMEMPQVGAEYMGAASGLFFSIGMIGGFSGPYILGRLFDITGSIQPGIFLMTAVVEAMIIITLLVKEN
jgi:cyanate permease